MTEDQTKMRLRISNPKHPHFNRIGFLTGKAVSLFGKPMAEIRFEDDEDGAFVSKGDCEILE